MTQYNSLNVNLSNSQLNELKSAIKNEAKVVLRLSSNMIGNSDDETNFPHKLLLTNRKVANLCKTFANYSSTDIIKLKNSIKNSKTQLSKMIQPRKLLGRLLGPTAQKTLFSFSRSFEKRVFPKKLHWTMIFLVLSGKMIFLFPENMILFFRQKRKDDLSQRKHLKI